jgi:hypothetical protein
MALISQLEWQARRCRRGRGRWWGMLCKPHLGLDWECHLGEGQGEGYMMPEFLPQEGSELRHVHLVQAESTSSGGSEPQGVARLPGLIEYLDTMPRPLRLDGSLRPLCAVERLSRGIQEGVPPHPLQGLMPHGMLPAAMLQAVQQMQYQVPEMPSGRSTWVPQYRDPGSGLPLVHVQNGGLRVQAAPLPHVVPLFPVLSPGTHLPGARNVHRRLQDRPL